jgi:hypothetical protein
MLTDNTQTNRKARIALFAMVPAVVGGLWLFNSASRDTVFPTTAVATSCSGFEADAHNLFDKGDTAVLRGTFAPGDHVHLAIDFNGVGNAWELTDVLAEAKKADVTGSGSFTKSIRVNKSIRFIPFTRSTSSTVIYGDISGHARLEVEIDVITAGDGAITINKTSSEPSLTPPRVASASCNASTRPTT